MNVNRLAVAAILGLSLALLLLWLLSVSPDLVQAGMGTLRLATTGSDTSAQDSTVNLCITNNVISSNVGPHNSMAVDSDGRLHVSFNNATSDGLLYAVFSDTTWHVQAIDTGVAIGRTSIAVDPNSGTPHTSYEESDDLKHAYLSGSEWISSTVVSGTRRHKQNAIAVDSNGYPHIAYSTDWQVGGGFWKGNVEYARWNGANWEIVTLPSHPHPYPYRDEEVRPPISLALDSQDNPQILHKRRVWGGYFGVRLQTQVSPTWQLTELEYGWYNTFPPGAALTIDDNDNAYWTYMWRGQLVGGTILPKTRLASSHEIGYSDITTDDAGRISAVFENGSTLQLAIKSPCDDEWTQTPLISISERGQSDVSLAVTQDVVHVIYYDGATQHLKHLSLPVASIIGHLEPLEVYPNEMVADANSTATITATVRDCAGQSLSNTPVTLTIAPSLDSTFVHPQTGTTTHDGLTDINGNMSATLKAGLQAGVITVTATADNMAPKSAAIRLTQASFIYLPLVTRDY